MISAWVLNACAKDLIWSATRLSAVFAATRSAVTAVGGLLWPSSWKVNFLRIVWFQLASPNPSGLIDVLRSMWTLYSTRRNMPNLDDVRQDIEHMRAQVERHRKKTLQLQRAGISSASAELLLGTA
jgi:hypothetical protein